MAEKKTLSAKEVVADIRSGATETELMVKFRLSEKQLESPFKKLVEAKVITQSDLDNALFRNRDLDEKRVLRKRLTKILWDKDEATLFVDQIAREVKTSPEGVRLVLKRYKKYMLGGGLATLYGLISLFASGNAALLLEGH